VSLPRIHAAHPCLLLKSGLRPTYDDAVIFKRVGEGRPYPDHDLGPRDWASLPPRPVRLDDLVTTKDTLQLGALLDEDSTFFGDLFAHVVEWRDDLYLEDGLHRALRAALQQRHVLHARVYVMPAGLGSGAEG
jgi:Arc/MetJ family transcription regulator